MSSPFIVSLFIVFFVSFNFIFRVCSWSLSLTLETFLRYDILGRLLLFPNGSTKGWQVIWMGGANWLDSQKGNLTGCFLSWSWGLAWWDSAQKIPRFSSLSRVLSSIQTSFNPHLVAPYPKYQCNPEILYCTLSRE